MSIPKYDELYFVLLSALTDGEEHPIKEVRKFVAQELNLTENDLQEMISSGQSVLSNRLGWASTYLKKAGLIEKLHRRRWKITPEGQKLMQNPPAVIDNHFLEQNYPSFKDFLRPQKADHSHSEELSGENVDETPENILDNTIAKINSALADDLMQEIMAHDSAFFERLVIQLLLKMGYGGAFTGSGIVTKSTGDGGIDGIIKEDKLGFSQIYIQAKRWNPDTTVSRPEIQKFAGALLGEGASKGLFITTAKFSQGAQQFADNQHIVLVDGTNLTRLMIEYNIGVSVFQTYLLKKVDADFFGDEL